MAEMLAEQRKHKKYRMNPNSLKNLEAHRIPKGVSGNPKGRLPKALSITESLREVAELLIDAKVDLRKMTFAQAAAYVHWQKAVKGDMETYSFITNRLEGKPRESIDQTVRVSHLPEELSDEQLAIIAAENIIKNHACAGGTGDNKAASSTT